MQSSSPPPAPDPAATAAATAKGNKETAIAEFGLNAANQNTPQGSSKWQQIGTWPDGTPRYQQDVTLSPEQQTLYNQQTQLGSNVNRIALDQSDRIGTLLGTPANLNNEATESRLMQLGSARLEPQFERDWDALENRLINRGAAPGSELYNNERDAFGQRKNDAYNQLLLTGRAQSVSEALAERNQPINEITALMAGGQVSQPQFQQHPVSQIANTDTAGIYNNAYQQQLQGWQMGQQSNNAMMGGLFGLGGAALGGWARGGMRF